MRALVATRGMPGELAVRSLERADLERIADIHAVTFPNSALTRLGKEAVRRYYEWQLVGPHDCLAIGAFDEHDLVGFCFGGIFRGALSGFIEANRLFLIRQVLIRPYLLTNPIFRTRFASGVGILKRLLRVRAFTKSGKQHRQRRSFGILSIAVNPSYQGRGVGRLLMDAVEAEARRGPFEAMHLTVHPGNLQAVQFYERLNWEKVLEEDEWKGSMRKRLPAKEKT